nr:uncharacterized protein CFP56_39797 [Quercus suber]
MDSDFIERMQRINLTAKEGEIIQVCPRQRERILEECSLSLFGKFLTTRQYNQRAVKNLLRTMWKFGSDLKIIDVGEGLFQFKFAMESQLVWVLNNGPWSFDNYYLLLRRWEKRMNASSIEFTHCPLWVQVWGLPFELFSEDVAKDIGMRIGKVVEVDCKSAATDQAKFLRIRVEVPLDKPLRRGSKIKGPDGEVPRGTAEQENQYGEWLKAGYRRMDETSKNKNQSHPRRREEAPTEQVQSETDRDINVTSENHGITQEINAINVSRIKGASVMDGNLKPSIPDSSPMPLDVITDKGEKQGIATDGQTENYGEQLFSVPITVDVATINSPNPKPKAAPCMLKSREQLEVTNSATLNTTERKESAKPGSYRKIVPQKKTHTPKGLTTERTGGKKRGLEVEDKSQKIEKSTGIESRKRQKYHEESDNMQIPTAAAASQPRREQ